MSLMRRQFFTQPKFQASFVFAFVRGAFVSLFIPAVGLFLAMCVLAHDPLITVEQKARLLQSLNQMVVQFLWMLLAVCALFSIMGAYLSYKFAGPVRRIETWLNEHALDQNPRPLKLRPGDELSSVSQLLARVFNR